MCLFAHTGITLPSLTSAVYFGVFLGLVWWWVFSRSISMLIFSSLCVMMAIFSGGHLLTLYLYQLPLSQQLVPPEDVYARYRNHYKVGSDRIRQCHLSFFVSVFLLHLSPSTLPRLFGMTGVIRTNSSDPYMLRLHTHVSWPDFVNPFVLLMLYYTLVALLHKWVHITEEVCVRVFICLSVCVCQGNTQRC